MANEFVTRTGLIVSGSTFLPAVTTASKGYILSFDDTTKQVYYMSTSSVTVTVPGSDTQVIYNNGGSFGASSNFVFSGSNVGIGTTSPQNKLHISGAASADAANIRIDSINEYGGLYVTENGTFRTFLGYGNAGTIFSNAQSDSTALRAANYLHLGASSAATLTINNSDYVGIGTTNPLSKLQVNKSSQAYTSPTASGALVLSDTTGTGAVLDMGVNTTYLSYIQSRYLDNSSVYQLLLNPGGGSVGIGTTAPGTTLDVAGTFRVTGSASTLGTFESSNSSVFIGLKDSSGDFVYLGNDDGDFLVQTPTGGYSTKLIVKDSGNVGIGISSPTALLHIAKNATYNNVSNTALRVANVTSPNKAIDFGYDNTADVGYIQGIEFGVQAKNLSLQSDGGNVGIGTTSPSYKLDVNSGTAASVFRVVSTNTTSSRIFFEATSGNVEQHFLYTGNQDWVLGLDKADSNKFKLASADDGFASSKLTVTTGGNIGIGTTSPSTKFVVSNAGASGLEVDPTGGVSSGVLLQAYNRSTSAYMAQSYYALSHTFNVGSGAGTRVLDITSGGRVGINTSSPASTLDVYASSSTDYIIATFGNNNSNVYGVNQFKSGSTITGYLGWHQSGYFFQSANNVNSEREMMLQGVDGITLGTNNTGSLSIKGTTADIITDSKVKVGIGTSTPNAKLDVNGNVIVTGSLTVSGSSTFTNIGPAVFTGSITQNASTASFGGVVGIGTTTPAAKLHTIGTGIVNIVQSSNDVSYTQYYNTSTSSGSTNDGLTVGVNGLDAYVYNRETSNLILGTADTERMRITSAGDVGIGTSSPTAKLDVRTDTGILIKGATSDTDGRVSIIPASGGRQYDLRNYGSSFGIKDASADVVRMFFHNNGNTGIANGTTTPTDTLQVEGGRISVTSGSTFGLSIEASGSGGRGGIISTKAGSDWNPVMYFTSQSRVGIGTGAPAYLLDVAGTGKFSGNINLGSSGEHYLQNDASTTFIGLNFDNPYIRFAVNNTERMRITSAGDVGIGTGSPNSTFQVSKGGVTFQVTDTNKTASNSFSVYGYSQTSWAIATGNSGSFSGGEKIIITDSGNIGIGTTTPDYRLEVESGASNSFFTSFTPSAGSGFIRMYQDSNNHLSIYGANASGTTNIVLNTSGVSYLKGGNVIVGGSADNGATFQVQGNVTATSFTGSFSGSVSAPGSTTQIVYNSGGALAADSGFVYSGSAVSIGTATPSSGTKLQVDGNIYSNNVGGNAFSINSVGANYGFILNNSANTFSLGYGSSLGTLGTSVLTWNSSGNVGIGTTTPSTALTVAGAISSSGATYVGGNLSVGTTYNGFAANISGTTYVIGASVWVNDGYGYANASSGGTGFFPSSSTAISINSGGNTRMFIASGSGNVGIGTTSPANNLHVYGTGDQIIKIENSGTYLMYLGLVSNEGYIGSTNATPLTFYTNNVNRMYITTGGNVGIGTTAPSEKLEVVGIISSARTTYGSPSDAGGFRLKVQDYGGINNDAGIGIDSDGGLMWFNNVNGGGFYWNDGTGGERMRLTAAGNLGIGTTSPATTLQVNGTARATRLNSTGGIIDFDAQTGNNFIQIASGEVSIANSGNVNMTITAAGNVGIGTTTPTDSKLEVNGNIGYTGDTNRYFFFPDVYQGTGSLTLQAGFGSALAGGAIAIYGHNTPTNSGSVAVGLSNVGDFKVQNYLGDSTKFIVKSSGNVGIGTTTPSSSLHVVGTITAATTVDSGRINLGTQDTNQIGLYRDNTYDLVLVQDASSGNPLYLAGAGDVRVSIDSNNNNTNSKFIVGNNDTKSSNELFSVDESGSGYFSGSLTVAGTITAQKLNVQQITSSVVYSSGSNIFGNSLANTQTFTGSIQATGSSHYFLGNVGIGTTSPNSRLSIQNSGTTDSIISEYRMTNGSNAATFRTDDNVIFGIHAQNAGDIYIKDASDNVLFYGKNGGNVGIGTTSPSSKLTVYSNTTYDGILIDVLSSPEIILRDRGNSDTLIGTGRHGLDDFHIDTYSGNAFFIKGNTRNVGIGTTSPDRRLLVSGSIGAFVANGQGTVSITVGEGSDVSGNIISLETNATANTTRLYNNGTGTSFNIGSTGAGADVNLSSVKDISLKVNNGADVFAGTTALFITGSTGNVGIGTTSPGALLDVNGSLNSGKSIIRVTNSDTANYITLGAGIPGVSNSGMNFTLDGTSRMVISAGGNVGIDNALPQYQLHVGDGSEAEHIMIQSDGGGATLRFYDSVNDSGGDRYQMIGHLDTTQKLQFSATSSGLIAMSINPDGKIGMGTTNPQYKLDVNGSFNTVTSGVNLTYNSGIIYHGSSYYQFPSGDYYYLYGRTGMGLIFGSNNAEVGRFDLSGNLGIGTNSPSYKLHVDGNTDSLIKVSNGTETYIKSTFYGYSSGYDVIQIGDVYGKGNNGVSVALGIDPSIIAGGAFSGYEIALPELTEFITANGPSGSATDWNQAVLVITGSNIGIGTGTPSYKLDVNGTGRFASGLDVDSYILTRTKLQISNGRLFELIGTSDALNIYDGSAGASRIYISGSGNVGIGTTSPARKLDVNGTSVFRDFTSVFAGSGNIVSNITWLSTDSGLMNIYTGGSATVQLNSNGVSYFNGGNVGIGTSSPGAKLQITGGTLDGASLTDLGISSGLTTGRLGTFDANSLASISTRGDASSVELAAGSSATYYTGISATANNATSFTGTLRFFTSGSEKVRITPSGNVGIGTTSPYAGTNVTSLDINATAYPVLALSIGSSYIGGMTGFSNHVAVSAKSGNYITLEPNDTEAVRITSAGNVGIGTSSPNTKFNIQETNSGTEGLIITNWNSVNTLLLGSDSSTGGGKITLRTNGGTSNVFISSYGISYFNGGNVGIGTDSPSYKLNVAATSATDADIFQAGMTGVSNGFSVQRVSSAFKYTFVDGNVGIGTTSPSNKLYVSATVEDYVAVIENLGTGTDKNGLWIKTDSSWTNSTVLKVTGDTSDTDIFRVNTANVRIGKGTFSVNDTALHVSGAITIEAQSTQTQLATTFSGTVSSNTNIAFVPTGSFKAAFFDYYVASGSVNMRAGTVMAVHNNSTSRYTDTSTADIGTTAPVDFSTSIVAGSLVLTANISSGTWEIKTAYRAL